MGESFNEAGAIMPRSGQCALPRKYGGAECFNEAGAIMPRSGRGGERETAAGRQASMRPGQSCPGVGGRPPHTGRSGAPLQ